MANKMKRYIRNANIFGQDWIGVFDEDGEVDKLFTRQKDLDAYLKYLDWMCITVVDVRHK